MSRTEAVRPWRAAAVGAGSGWLAAACTDFVALPRCYFLVSSCRRAKTGTRKINGKAFCLQKLIFMLVFGLKGLSGGERLGYCSAHVLCYDSRQARTVCIAFVY